MAPQHIKDLIRNHRAPVVVGEVDVRYGAQRYLREKLGSGGVGCAAVRGNSLEFTAASSAVKQEVFLRRYELGRWLKKEYGYRLSRIIVRTS